MAELVTTDAAALAQLIADALVEPVAELLAAQRRPPALLSRADAAAALGISLPKLDALVRHRQCPHVRIGASVRFDLGEVLAWLKDGGAR